jgi:hypothetical protein
MSKADWNIHCKNSFEQSWPGSRVTDKAYIYAKVLRSYDTGELMIKKTGESSCHILSRSVAHERFLGTNSKSEVLSAIFLGGISLRYYLGFDL